jgi:hypothetical protein
MSVIRVIALLVGLCGLVGLPSLASADLGPLNALVMPGKLSDAHAKLEGECGNCHTAFKKSAQSELCLDCHDHQAVAEDIVSGRGFHGHIEEPQCNTCHKEHQGRRVNIAPLNKRTFDHDLTDYPLHGAHADPAVKCEDCHKRGLKYRDAPSNCYACHRSDDAHKGSRGKECVNCHIEDSWQEVHFDHSATGFPLIGKHRLVKCDSCHADERYKDTPKNCYACHKADDRKRGHKGGFGSKCGTCHTPEDWRVSIFDHNRHTTFPLRGKHRTIKCTACHKGILYKENLSKNCFGCHKQDDVHKGQQGKNCGKCHNEGSWTRRLLFDHGLIRFPLLGAHTRLQCKDCHKEPTFKDARIECVSCHLRDDTHKRRLGSLCERCHNSRDWRDWDFDHNQRTKFHLDGAHQGLDCHACHKKPVTKNVSLATGCVSCHSADDVHRGAFGRFCEQCHTTTSFREIEKVLGTMQ